MLFIFRYEFTDNQAKKFFVKKSREILKVENFLRKVKFGFSLPLFFYFIVKNFSLTRCDVVVFEPIFYVVLETSAA